MQRFLSKRNNNKNHQNVKTGFIALCNKLVYPSVTITSFYSGPVACMLQFLGDSPLLGMLQRSVRRFEYFIRFIVAYLSV